MKYIVYLTTNTVREARKEFSNVGKVLRGLATHCHNFIFKYEE